VRTGNAEGNAVVYVKDASGNIAWSWHIWVTNYDPNNGGTKYTNNGFTFMDRNLGAKNAEVNSSGSYGYLYQWGRKDPIPFTQKLFDSKGDSCFLQAVNITSSVSNYVNLAIQNPLTFYSTSLTSDDWYSTTLYNLYLWSTSSGLKNVYDPCPKGWRVPVVNSTTNHPWTGLVNAWNGFGENWSTTMGWYPANSWRWSGAASIGSLTEAFYWTATSVSGTERSAYHLYFDSKGAVNLSTFAKGDAFPVRCVKE
jgi:uncharacterized protein (TIGR02145 family)